MIVMIISGIFFFFFLVVWGYSMRIWYPFQKIAIMGSGRIFKLHKPVSTQLALVRGICAVIKYLSNVNETSRQWKVLLLLGL